MNCGMHIFSFFIDQHFRFNLPESTIRMWLKKSDGLDYRGPSYHKPPTEKMRFQGRFQVCLHQYFPFLFSIRNSLLTRRMTSILKLGPASMHRLILAVCGMKSWPRIGHLKQNDGTLYYISLDQGNRVEWPFEAVPRRVSADPDGSVQRDKVNWGIDVFKTLQNSAFSIQAE